MERRLTTILAAGVVRYSGLMEADEAATLATLKAHRARLIDPPMAEHHGRVVKLTGDGVPAEFGSVVEAVTCALAIQTGMAGRNEGVGEDRRIVFRIGVHPGDVMVEDDDLYGDGVNVAARLEGLAEPGSVCISQQALERGIEALRPAIELDPYFSAAYARPAILYTAGGRPADGLRSVETAMRLNPRYPSWYLFMRSVTGFCLANYRSAIADFVAARERSPTAPFIRWFLAATCAQAGQVDDAAWAVEELGMMDIEPTIGVLVETQPIQDPECLTRYRTGLRKAGIPG